MAISLGFNANVYPHLSIFLCGIAINTNNMSHKIKDTVILEICASLDQPICNNIR